MHTPLTPQRPAVRRKRYAPLALSAVLGLALPAFAAAQTGAADAANRSTLESAPSSGALNPTYYLNFGARFGNDGPQGYSDMILPLYNGQSGILFFNPRVSLADEGQGDFSVGLGLRGMVAPGLVLGGGLYADAFETRHGNRIDQWGLGLELLSDWVDLRANWYDAEGGKDKIGEYNNTTVVTDSRTTATTRAVSSTSTNIRQGEGFQASEPFATENRIAYAVTGAAYVDYITRTDYTTTYKTTTTRTSTTRWFERYEAGMDGWDAELGFKLPWNVGPETRVFGGWYSYDDPWGSDVEGWRARLEVKTGPWLSFDGELYEDDKLYGSDWFVGARVQIPLSRDLTWQQFRDGLFSMRHRDLDERMRGEMAHRAARVHTAESDWTENQARRLVEVATEVSTRTRKYSKTSTETEQIGEPGKATVITLKDGITFVDGTVTGGAGTAENPYRTIAEATQKAGKNNTIFVYANGREIYTWNGVTGYKAAAGSTPYNDQVTVKTGQTVTSVVSFTGHPLDPGTSGSVYNTYSTPERPEIKVDNLVAGEAAVTMQQGSTLEHVNVTANGNAAGDIYGVQVDPSQGSGDVNIRDSIIVVENTALSGKNAVGVYMKLNAPTMGALTIEDSEITVKATEEAYGIYAEASVGKIASVNVTGNKKIDVTSTAAGVEAYGVYADVGAGAEILDSMSVTGNTINVEATGNPFGSVGIDVNGTSRIGGGGGFKQSGNTITVRPGGTEVNEAP